MAPVSYAYLRRPTAEEAATEAAALRPSPVAVAPSPVAVRASPSTAPQSLLDWPHRPGEHPSPSPTQQQQQQRRPPPPPPPAPPPPASLHDIYLDLYARRPVKPKPWVSSLELHKARGAQTQASAASALSSRPFDFMHGLLQTISFGAATARAPSTQQNSQGKAPSRGDKWQLGHDHHHAGKSAKPQQLQLSDLITRARKVRAGN